MVNRLKHTVKRKHRSRHQYRTTVRGMQNRFNLRDSMNEIFAGLIWLG